jgi:hypothetical protein
MSGKTVGEIEQSIAELGLPDQVRLLQYLAPGIAGAVLNSAAVNLKPAANGALQQFRAAGERLAATSVPGAPSLTEAISQQRR